MKPSSHPRAVSPGLTFAPRLIRRIAFLACCALFGAGPTYAGDLAPGGALIAANTVRLDVAGDLANGGTIAGRELVSLSAENIKNLGGRIEAASTALFARQDIDNLGGSFSGADTLTVLAGRDLNIASTTRSSTGAGQAGNTRTNLDRLAGLYVTHPGATLVAAAGRDLELTAAVIANTGANTTAASTRPGVNPSPTKVRSDKVSAGETARTTVQAGRNLTLATLDEADTLAIGAGRHTRQEARQGEVGTTIHTNGDLTLAAGADLSMRAARVSSEQGAIGIRAGGDLLIEAGQATARAAEQHKYKSRGFLSSTRTSTRDTVADTRALASTVSAETVTLAADHDLTLRGSQVVATQDLIAAAGRDLTIEAATETHGATHEKRHTKSGVLSTALDVRNKTRAESIAQGSIVRAGGDLTLIAGAAQGEAAPGEGTLTLHGSALDAGGDLAIQSSGDLQLLAAYSQSRETEQRTKQTRRKLETLDFEIEQTRLLLPTLSAGHHLDVRVGGDLAAQTGGTDAAGNLQADRMSASGVIEGGQRQQIHLTHTDNKKDTITDGPTSKVLGNLAARGLRSGAQDSFAPAPVRQGEAALAALLQGRLITIRNQPGVQAALGAPTQNGSALTYQDDSGKISLTLAGQARVQAVYNQLRLTETFDVKHFADQGTAQVVTLVAAVALTTFSAGAGAALIGAATGTASAAAANAAFIAMTSTMSGQLAGGASFEEAFEAGLKAGVSSAISAGIASGIDQYVSGVSGSATPTTIQSGTQSIQSGTHAAASGLSNLDRLGTTAYWQQSALNATVQGTLTSLQGGRFKEGFAGSVVGSLSASGAGIIGESTAGMPLANIAAHAVLGCASAAAGGKDCAAGAIGGAGSATVARLIDGALADIALSETAKNTLIASGGVVGSMAIAGALGKDVIAAGNAAGNEVLNNYLKHREISTKLKELDECKSAASPGACSGEVERRYNAISRQNSSRLISCKTPDECRAALAEFDVDKVQMQSRREELERRLYANQLSPAERREYQLLNDNIDNALGGSVTIAGTEERLLQQLASVVGPLNFTPQESERMLRAALMTGGGVAGATALARGRPGAAGTEALVGAAKGGFPGYLSNSTAPEIRQALVSQTAEIRRALPLEFQSKGNLAIAEIDVPGLPQDVRAFSQFQNGELGFAPRPTGPTIFEPMEIGKGGVVNGKNAFLRDVDGEFKILENLARALGNNPSATGRINLFTELQSCTSCAGTVMQFRQRYPGIQLNVFTGKQ